MELALIALDGLDPRVVYRNPDRMPVLHEIMKDSMHGKWSTPGHTIPSFTAALTGQQYEVVNFHWDEGKGEYQRHRQTEFDYLWDVIGSSMTIVNNPILYPPEDIDDAMVCGLLTPDELADSNLARPKEVQEIINSMDYIHDIPSDNIYDKLGGEGMFELLDDMMEFRAELSSKLIEEYDSDLFFGTWTAPDRWFHQCHLHDEDYIRMYELVDDKLKKIVPFDSDIPIIIFSDHGFAHYPEDGKGVHKGHMYEGFYCINYDGVPSCRDDSASIFDLFPTVVNYLDGEMPRGVRGRILFNTDEQNQSVKDRLSDLGYLE